MNNSDHSKPSFKISSILPEVHRSEHTNGLFGQTFDRHLTKDDVVQSVGYVGKRKASALINKQLIENTPHRQAFQLAPTVVTTVGAETTSLSYKAFGNQLELMGVDLESVATWGKTPQFNWVPPVNLDMLVNYQNYFWSPTTTNDPVQYFTVENRCNKALSKVDSYANTLAMKGSEFDVSTVGYADDSFTVEGGLAELFTVGFSFNTVSTNINLSDKKWTVALSEYSVETDVTTVHVVESIANSAIVPPAQTSIASLINIVGGSGYLNGTYTAKLMGGNGTGAAATIVVSGGSVSAVTISSPGIGFMVGDVLTVEPIDIGGGSGFTVTVGAVGYRVGHWWYDSSISTLLEWNGTAFVQSAPARGVKVDLTRMLDQYKKEAGCVCNENFGWDTTRWDYGDGEAWDYAYQCKGQNLNQWSDSNKWVHKTQVTSFAQVKRAQAPILEFNSTVEMNEWAQVRRSWKYRSDVDHAFKSTTVTPSRLELEPIKGFVGTNVGGTWTIYLTEKTKKVARDVDYTNTFVPGFKFKVTDSVALTSQVYTVATVEYRQILSTDPAAVTNLTGTQDETGAKYFCTIITIAEPIYYAAVNSTTASRTWIEPVVTSAGDIWRGYHAHWVLDAIGSETVASSPRAANIALAASLASTTPTYRNATPGTSPNGIAVKLGQGFQEHITNGPATSTFDIISEMQFNGTVPRFYSLAGSADLRVYVDNVRQYGTYTEGVTDVKNQALFTVVGSEAIVHPPSQTVFSYVSSVTFNDPLPEGKVVRIESSPAAQEDAGMFAVPVRTVEDEVEFTIGVANGTQPVYSSLTKYHRLEQRKTETNQYPQFNVYDTVSSEVVAAAPLFAFNESSDSPINKHVGKRIVSSADSKEYEFKQTLLQEANGRLYAYRTIDRSYEYWYSPLLKKVQKWDGAAWSDSIPVVVGNGIALRKCIISKTEPTYLRGLVGSLWMNPTTLELKKRVGTTWVIQTNVEINGTDPTLQTVWKQGKTNQEYVPKQVDKNGNIPADSSVASDWELANQWRLNPEHKNAQYLLYSQLLTHFTSILNNQAKLPGLYGGGTYALTQNQIDYGVGGTIKEHNNSYDTLVSAVNVSSIAPIGAIEFAQQQYLTGLRTVRELFNTNIVRLLTTYQSSADVSMTRFMADKIIEMYESNDFTSQVFANTTAFNNDTNKGIRNWVATPPMLGLTQPHTPHMVVLDNGNVEILHHDGHRSSVEYTGGEADRLARLVCDVPDPRVGGAPIGKVSPVAFPSTESQLTTALGALRTGVYWYQSGNGVRKLSRFSPYLINGQPPALFTPGGAELADGLYYYNTSDNITYVKAGLAWVAASVTPGDISMLWTEVELDKLLAGVILEVETRLSDSLVEQPLKYDYSMLLSNQSSAAKLDALMKEQFGDFVSSNDISVPYTNVAYAPANPFTWNYASCTPLTPPASGVVGKASSSWQELYTSWYGTPYPNAEPWKLQQYSDKPSWWDEEYADPTNTRRWKYNHATTTGMWENIRVGVVPAGRTYPNGEPSTGNAAADGQLAFVNRGISPYNYFSVNISDVIIPGGYKPDSMLPPYYDNSSISTASPTVRSLFVNYSGEIASPDADFVFGDGGPVEWSWKVSAQYTYDKLVTAFKIDPVVFLHSAFGPAHTLVGGLNVETTIGRVYSHKHALFHGDSYDTSKVYQANGINQWYVNFNRYTGTDTNGQFRQQWAEWNPRLTYQTGAIIDTSSFSIGSRFFDFVDQDYDLMLVKTGVLSETWVDAFNVKLITIPPSIVQYNNQSAWQLEIDSLATRARSIQYFGVKSYPFTADVSTNTFTAFVHNITSVDSATRRMTVAGNFTPSFAPGSKITISGAGANDGVYTVHGAAYESAADRTRVTLQESFSGTSAVGQIRVDQSIPWNTGDKVVLASTKFLPAPFRPDTPYFVIRLSDTTFKLAEDVEDALINYPIQLSTVGTGSFTVSEVASSFYAYNGAGNTQDLWFHYAIDRNVVHTLDLPAPINGMQTLVDIIDGYSALQKESGVLSSNAGATEYDPESGLPVGWDTETERFINWAYGLRQSNVMFTDKYNVAVDGLTSSFSFTTAIPMWLNGTPVSVHTSGVLPSPLISGSKYYVVNRGTNGEIRLSTSANSVDTSSYVTLFDAGSGQMSIGLHEKSQSYPGLELNPNRNNVWLDIPLGTLSNVITGPYDDIRLKQTIFDQYGRPLGSDKLSVYRGDTRSQVTIKAELPNDIDPMFGDDPYNYIHMGGAHLFVEGYEHYLVLSDYSVDGSLIYDSFLGLNLSTINLDFLKGSNYTNRPNLGGYFLLGQEFQRNMVGAADDVRNYYDVTSSREGTEPTKRSRALIGYAGKTESLSTLSVGSKAQLRFYQGMIQTKGSINSVNAYTNSRRFVDAKLDEFWAWKIADFGDSRPKLYPEVKLFSTDSTAGDVKLKFIDSTERATDPEIIQSVSDGFKVIDFTDATRWNIFPEQKAEIKSPLFLDADVTSAVCFLASSIPPSVGSDSGISMWLNTSTFKMYAKSATGEWNIDVTSLNATVLTEGTTALDQSVVLYYSLPKDTDDVRIIRKLPRVQSFVVLSTPVDSSTVVLPNGYFGTTLYNGRTVMLSGVGTNNGAHSVVSTQYDGTNTLVTLSAIDSSGNIVPSNITTNGFDYELSVQDLSVYDTERIGLGSSNEVSSMVGSRLVKLAASVLDGVYTIFSIDPSRSKITPAKIIDTKSGAVVHTMPLWDPARGHHSPYAVHDINLMVGTDPARYTDNPVQDKATLNYWGGPEVGKTWLDTSKLRYVPYHDRGVYPMLKDRLSNWGALTSSGRVAVYQWVSSPVPPAEWSEYIGTGVEPGTTGVPMSTTLYRARKSVECSVDFTTNKLSATSSAPWLGNSTVRFTSSDTLPIGIEPETTYYVGNVVGNEFQIFASDPNILTSFEVDGYVSGDDNPIEIIDAGIGTLTMTRMFELADWNVVDPVIDRTTAPNVVHVLNTKTSTQYTNWPYTTWGRVGVDSEIRLYWTPADVSKWMMDTQNWTEQAIIYVNGELQSFATTVYRDLDVGFEGMLYVVLPFEIPLNAHDQIEIQRVTAPDFGEDYDPPGYDDGTSLLEWKIEFPYSTETVRNDAGSVDTRYYFWVTDFDAKGPSGKSTIQIQNELTNTTSPYFVVQNPKDDSALSEAYGYGLTEFGSRFSLGVLTEAEYQTPVAYRDAILRNVARSISDTDRYIVRFTRDFTLRDQLESQGHDVNLKNTHQEWLMFRKSQPSTLPRALWDRLTESLIGVTLKPTRGVLQRVPTLERQMYDEMYNTDTRYGLGVDQAFVNKELGLAVIFSYLTDLSNDFTPINMDSFFAEYSFDTPDDIAIAMDAIYNGFNARHVNALWFAVLDEALACKKEYKELIKTSWIALHGIRVLESNGAFDD